MRMGATHIKKKKKQFAHIESALKKVGRLLLANVRRILASRRRLHGLDPGAPAADLQ